MKTNSIAVFIFGIFSISLMSGCLDRESEIIESTFSYDLYGGRNNIPISGTVYNDGIFIIGEQYITLEKFEVGRFEFSSKSGNVVVDDDGWRSDFHHNVQGYFEIASIRTFNGFYEIDGNFEFNTYDINDLTKKREYRNGSFRNLIVEISTENLSDGWIQIEMEGLSLRQYACGLLVFDNQIECIRLFSGPNSITMNIPFGTSPGEYPVTFGNQLPLDYWKFKFCDVDKIECYRIAMKDETMGWPKINIEESDYATGYIRGTISGYFATYDNLLDFIYIKNGSFEFNW